MADNVLEGQASPEGTARGAAYWLHRARQASDDLMAQALDGSGLTVRQLTVLEALAAAQGAPASQSDLVAATGIDRSTLAEMIGRMEARGLVRRQRSTRDARANDVLLAEAGEAALAEARTLAQAADMALIARLPRKHRDSFVLLLMRLAMPEVAAALKAGKGKKRKKKRKDKALKAADQVPEPAGEAS
jgi:MarR family transcriptional regulator, temperature-dependent positive regulator of motility